MSKYENVTLKEYMKNKLEMLNDLGRTFSRCEGINCNDCPLSIKNNKTSYNCNELEILEPERALEIVMNYIPKVDWSEVPIDAQILVKDRIDEPWNRRHFAKYKDGKVYSWPNGLTSYSCGLSLNEISTCWNYAKLYKEEK